MMVCLSKKEWMTSAWGAVYIQTLKTSKSGLLLCDINFSFENHRPKSFLKVYLLTEAKSLFFLPQPRQLSFDLCPFFCWLVWWFLSRIYQKLLNFHETWMEHGSQSKIDPVNLWWILIFKKKSGVFRWLVQWRKGNDGQVNLNVFFFFLYCIMLDWIKVFGLIRGTQANQQGKC